MQENEKKPKIFVATPMYGGMCAGFYTQAIIQLLTTCQANGVDVEYSFMFNESLITRARNSLTHTFMQTDCSHLMFIDADIKFRAEDVIHMIRAEKDILCGIYPKKEINWHSVKAAMDRGVPFDQLKSHTGSFVVNLVNYVGEVTVPVNQPVEIFNGGTGFMLIKREVFDKLGESVPSYSNDVVDLGGKMKQSEPIKEFFTTSIEPGTNRLLSEDYHFCRIWRETGGQVHAAPWCQLSHIGTYAFEGQLTPTA
tara:strand:+ start:332 stop:1090 length:759 start_codon:yes stop_codon:yes gene_type:complete